MQNPDIQTLQRRFERAHSRYLNGKAMDRMSLKAVRDAAHAALNDALHNGETLSERHARLTGTRRV